MKRIITALALMLFVIPLKAQDDESSYKDYNKSRYEDFKKKKLAEMKQYTDSVQQDYIRFRQKANEEYARFMREHWEEFQSIKGDSMPVIPDPPQPYNRDKNYQKKTIPKLPIKYNKVFSIPSLDPKLLEQPKRTEIPVDPVTPSVPEYNFMFYGTSCMVLLDPKLNFRLSDVSENTVADTWTHLSKGLSEVLLEDFLRLRDELALGDWAYYCLIRSFSEQCFGKGSNEAVLMETFMMAQSGYKARIARSDNGLALMLCFDSQVYQMTYLFLDGEKFYIMDNGRGDGRSSSYYVFNRSFMKSDRPVSLRMPGTPKLAFKSSGEKTFKSKKYPDMTVTLSLNSNLMDFYKDYPKCLWANYSWAGLSDEVKSKLYPVLRKSIEGKSQIDAANRLINFVQTAFAYQSDGKQFGCERFLFADETFFFPYSDCEDRAILFSVLVRDLLGLDVVLLHYPDHIATAVHFTESLEGTYLTLDGKPYYICDPAFIGANVGDCMPRYANSNPEVYKL